MSVRQLSPRIFPFTLVFFVVLGAGVPFLCAQPVDEGPRVTVVGSVTDRSGGVLPGTAIEARVGGRIIADVQAASDGRYRIEVPSGVLVQLRARRDGFDDQTLELHTVSSEVTRDIVLGVGAMTDVVVVTASRNAESRATSTESIAVLDAADIASLGSTQLGDVVRWVPGLNVEATGREGAIASLFARGGESDYNLVLVDGVRVNNSGGQFDFNRISGAEIARVEVVRGAQSALYGSDAIGSVVQVFTRRAGISDPPELSGFVEGGNLNTWRGDLRILGGARRRLDYHTGVSHRSTDGAFGDILPERDRFDETVFNGNVGFAINEHATVRTGLRYVDAKGRAVGQIAYGARDTGTAADTKDLSWHLDFSQQIASRVDHAATIAYFRAERTSDDRIVDSAYDVFAVLEGTPGAIFPDSPRLARLVDQDEFNRLLANTGSLGPGQFLARTTFPRSDFLSTFESEFRRPAVRYQVNTTWRQTQRFSAGYEYERETDPLNDGFRVDNNAYFVQQQFNAWDRWFAGIGARINDNSRYGTEVIPKLSLGGYLRPFTGGPISSVKAFGNVGKGIKNPVFGELYGSAFTDGNPELHPERARTVDVGTEITFNDQRWLARVVYFNNHYKDQVAFRSTGFVPDGRPDFLNIDGSKATGWELEAALQRPLAGVMASAGYALVDSEVVASVSTSEQFQPGQPLLRRPKHSGTVRVTYVRKLVSANVDLRAVGQRHDAAFLGLMAVPSPQFPTGRAVDITVNPGYVILGLGAEVRVHEALTLFARVDNLTDETYESVLGYPGLPRTARLGGRFRIGTR
ncbi:MAG TPA: TonB-dependent receptor [Vicinamibacterales bacterium]|jgi:outer membrane cobalamin receptor